MPPLFSTYSILLYERRTTPEPPAEGGLPFKRMVLPPGPEPPKVHVPIAVPVVKTSDPPDVGLIVDPDVIIVPPVGLVMANLQIPVPLP